LTPEGRQRALQTELKRMEKMDIPHKDISEINIDDLNQVYEVTITSQDLYHRWVGQNGYCYFSGLPIKLDRLDDPFCPFAPSIDRIDNDKDYHLDNIVLTWRMVNLGRGPYAKEDFREEFLEALENRCKEPIFLADLNTGEPPKIECYLNEDLFDYGYSILRAAAKR